MLLYCVNYFLLFFADKKEDVTVYLTCLDLEGVLIPEIWIEFAKARHIDELLITTREEPDYIKLMHRRIEILNSHNLKLHDIQETIATLDPLPGAKEFLDELRSFSQTVIISDTFVEFAMPLIKKLGYPSIFCNSLDVAPDGTINEIKMRVDTPDPKLTTVQALQGIGLETIASGDSYNDVGMVTGSPAGGFFFRTTDKIKGEYPDVPAYEEYSELLAAIKKAQGITD